MNQREYSIIIQQLENVNRCLTLVENSNSLIHQVLNNNSNNNNRSRRQPENRYYTRNSFRSNNLFNNDNIRGIYNNNSINDNNSINNNNSMNENNENTQTYVLRFDTLLPNLSNIMNAMYDVSNNTRDSYNYRIYNYENNNVSMNEIIDNYDLLDIKNFELIENPINDICPITRDRFHNSQNVMMICSCKHVFNKSSLNIWIQNNNSCPSCRSMIKRNHNSDNNNMN